MVIFNSYVNLPEGNFIHPHGQLTHHSALWHFYVSAPTLAIPQSSNTEQLLCCCCYCLREVKSQPSTTVAPRAAEWALPMEWLQTWRPERQESTHGQQSMVKGRKHSSQLTTFPCDMRQPIYHPPIYHPPIYQPSDSPSTPTCSHPHHPSNCFQATAHCWENPQRPSAAQDTLRHSVLWRFSGMARWDAFVVMVNILIKKKMMIQWWWSSWFWANYNNSLTWFKAIWGWFPLLTIIYPDDCDHDDDDGGGAPMSNQAARWHRRKSAKPLLRRWSSRAQPGGFGREG